MELDGPPGHEDSRRASPDQVARGSTEFS